MLQVTYHGLSASCWPCRMWWWWKGWAWGRFPKQNEPGTLPCKSGEVGACKDLEGNIFTIRSGNKGKDGDMLRTSKEKLALYRLVWAKKVTLAAICLEISSASFGIRIN
jgi:hypothetical protein